ncbi:MAG: immunity 51 family protein [Oscillospiraceae bacterium]|nr:immunity 51 family protein [Oscillospiraceae bacterium]
MKMKITAITVFMAAGLICSGCSEASENERVGQEPQTLTEDTENLESENMSELSPFRISEYEGTYSLLLDVDMGYLEDIFEARENEGLLPNGYGWEALAMAFIENECPEYEDAINFDSEAGMFCAYCSDRETLESFAAKFKAACEDSEKITEILSKADPDNF